MWRALAISLAVHGLLLWPSAAPRPPDPAAGTLMATLRPLQAVAPVASIPETPKPVVAASTPVFRSQSPVAAPPPALLQAAEVRRAAVPPAPTFFDAPAAVVSPPVALTAGAGERSAGVAVAPAVGVVAAARVAAPDVAIGIDADGVRQYRLALARESRRYKRYPERALLAGIGGTAEVRVEHETGAAPVARLARSSGDESLDAAAVSMLRQAAPHTSLPESLRGRSFAVSLPVVFDVSAE